MVIALLIMLGATVYSGLVVYALDEGRGPLATIVMAVPAPAAGSGKSCTS
jgi:hypothetical protein